MGFFESLGNIRADLQMPLAERQLRSRYQLENQQIEDALNQAVALRQQQQQGEEGQTFSESDKLKYHQLLQRANINPAAIAQADKYRAEAEQGALRTRALEQSFDQIDNPYARANIANKLDVSPNRMVGQNVYNRFDTDNWLVGTTAKGQAETQSAFQDVHQKNIELEVLQDVLDDPNMPFSKKLDYLSGKEISENERVAMTDPKTGEKVYGTRYWTPSGTKIKKDTDSEGGYVSIPVEDSEYAQQRNIADLRKAGYEEGEATRIILGKDKSNAAIYADISTANKSGKFNNSIPITDDFELTAANINGYMQERPGFRLPGGLKKTLKHLDLTEDQQKELLGMIDNVNGIADLVSSNDQIQADAIEEETTELPISAITANAQPELPELPQTQPIQQQPQPLTPEIMNSAYQAFVDGASPADIRQRLEDNGFDMSPETIGVMAIDAINQGADPQQVSERFKAMGYDLGALGL